MGEPDQVGTPRWVVLGTATVGVTENAAVSEGVTDLADVRPQDLDPDPAPNPVPDPPQKGKSRSRSR